MFSSAYLPWSLSLHIQSECREQYSSKRWDQQKHVKQMRYHWGQTATQKVTLSL